MLIIILKKMCILCLLMDSFMQIDYLLRMQVINSSCKCFRRKCIFFNWKKLKKKIPVTRPIVLQILQHQSCSMMVVLLYVHKIM